MSEINTQEQNYTPALGALTTLFFMWGFITVMNDSLIPYLKGVFSLNNFESMLIQLAFFGAYFLGSLIYFFISGSSGDPINKIGYKNGIIIGLIVAAVGTSLFYPAAEFHSYLFFLSALFVIGLGFTILQIAANPYVAILGSEKTSSSRLNLAQGFNSIGTALAPVIGVELLFSIFGSAEGSDAVKAPYLFFAGLFLLLAVLIKFAKLPRFTSRFEIEKGFGALKYRHLRYGMIAIFMYVGAEVSIGSIMIGYLGLENIAGLSEEEAGIFVSLYWGGLMIGRFIGAISLSKLSPNIKNSLTIILPVAAFIYIASKFGFEIGSYYGIILVINIIAFFAGKSIPARSVFIFALCNISLLVAALLSDGTVAMWAVIGVGLFNSIMWSNIFTLSIAGLGKYTSQGSSLLVMMILGGALIPPIQGLVADNFGIHFSYITPIIPYVYIAFFGLYGYKIKNEKQLKQA